MAGGFLGLESSLLFPGEVGKIRERQKGLAKGEGAGENPLFGGILNQLLTRLNPKTQRKQLRRQYSNIGAGLGNQAQNAMASYRSNLAQRGLGGSAFGAAGEAGIQQQYGDQLAQLPGLYHQQLAQNQQDTRNEALQFLSQIIGLRQGTRGTSEQVVQRKQAQKLGPKDWLAAYAGMVNAGAQAAGAAAGG